MKDKIVCIFGSGYVKLFLQAKTVTKKCSRSSKRHGNNFYRHDYWHALCSSRRVLVASFFLYNSEVCRRERGR